MSQVASVLENLAALGVTLKTDGENLSYHPVSAVDDGTLNELRIYKSKLIELLQDSEHDSVTHDTSSQNPRKTRLLSQQIGEPDTFDEMAEKLVGDLFQRVNLSFPAGGRIEDWSEIDNRHAAICDARRRRDLNALVAAIAAYESYVIGTVCKNSRS